MSEAKIKSNKSKLKHRLAEVLVNNNNNGNGVETTNPSQKTHSNHNHHASNRRSLSTVALQSSHNHRQNGITTSHIINKSYMDLSSSVDDNNNVNGGANSDEFEDELAATKRVIENKNMSSPTTTTPTTTTANGNKSNSPNYSITAEDIEAFNRVNEEDLFVDNSRWLSEKPISVLQLDLADRAVLKIAGMVLFSIQKLSQITHFKNFDHLND